MRFVFDRKHVATKNKKGLVQIEVTSEGRRKWIGTSVKLYSDQWHEKRKVVNSLNSIQLNAILDGMMAKLNEFILDLVRNNQQFDFEKLNAFLEKSTRSDSFIEFVYNPQIQISVVSGTKRSIFRQKNKTKRSKKRLHTTLIKPEQKVNEDLCSGFIVS